MKPTKPSYKTAICSAKEVDNWLVSDMKFPALRAKKIFIRKCYEEVADNIIQYDTSSDPAYVIVSGTPGVGKSVFSNHLLWKIFSQGKRVLFMSQYPVYYDGKGGVFNVRYFPDEESTLWGPDLWVLIDSRDPIVMHTFPYEQCSIVLFTTARADITSQFLNLVPVPIRFWIPIWAKDEIKAVAEGLYPNRNDWESRFEVLGGVPHHIFQSLEDPRTILHNACTECDFKTCIKVVTLKSQYTSKSNVCQVLIHMNFTSLFRSCEIIYASNAAVQMIVQKYSHHLRINMESLLASCAGNRLSAALCGYIFEPYARKQLARGGDFKYRRLVNGRSKIKPVAFTITVPKSPESLPLRQK